MRRRSVITPTPPPSPTPTLLDGDSSGLGGAEQDIQQLLQLDHSQDDEVFLFNEHNSGFLRSSRSLESTLPIHPDQDRLDWEARQETPVEAQEYPAGTRSRAFEPGSPRDCPSRDRSWSSPENSDYFLQIRPQIIISRPSTSTAKRALGPSASSTLSGDNFRYSELLISTPILPQVPQPQAVHSSQSTGSSALQMISHGQHDRTQGDLRG